MSCEKLETLKKIAISDPGQIRGGTWDLHIEMCGECRRELSSMEDTLAVFFQLENERLSRSPSGPSWEKICAVLHEQNTSRPLRSWQILAAAVVGAFIVGATASWAVFQPFRAPDTLVADSATNVSTSAPASQIPENVNPQQLKQTPNEIWGELRVRPDGSLELVSETDLRAIPNRRQGLTLELAVPTPSAIPVSNR